MKDVAMFVREETAERILMNVCRKYGLEDNRGVVRRVVNRGEMRGYTAYHPVIGTLTEEMV